MARLSHFENAVKHFSTEMFYRTTLLVFPSLFYDQVSTTDSPLWHNVKTVSIKPTKL